MKSAGEKVLLWKGLGSADYSTNNLREDSHKENTDTVSTEASGDDEYFKKTLPELHKN